MADFRRLRSCDTAEGPKLLASLLVLAALLLGLAKIIDDVDDDNLAVSRGSGSPNVRCGN